MTSHRMDPIGLLREIVKRGATHHSQFCDIEESIGRPVLLAERRVLRRRGLIIDCIGYALVATDKGIERIESEEPNP